jgi:protoheme IX farnesyltransferase
LFVWPARAVAPRGAAATALQVRALVSLTKPRIIELLLITTVPTMVLARRGLPSAALVLATLAGGALTAGGANALNMYIDRDIDAVMQRTQRRPLVTGVISPATALVFALTLEVAGFVELTMLVNVFSAALAVSATAFYIGVYTLWLKRTSSQNIVIGGAAGAVPVLVGWVAVTGRLAWAPIVLFAVIFVWTPPHFWALAVKYRDDYGSAGVPMLPAVSSLRTTAQRILVYSVAVLATSLLLVPIARTGLIYLASAVVLGVIFVAMAVAMYRDPTPRTAMRLFGYSITYLSLLFAAVAVDQIVRVR